MRKARKVPFGVSWEGTPLETGQGPYDRDLHGLGVLVDRDLDRGVGRGRRRDQDRDAER